MGGMALHWTFRAVLYRTRPPVVIRVPEQGKVYSREKGLRSCLERAWMAIRLTRKEGVW